jgi:branched-chain amino acid aminotransferase
MSQTLVYLDGEFVRAENAKLSVYDHSLLYGDGIFEGIRAYEGVVFQLSEHIDRLYRSARILRLNIPVDKEKMLELVLESLRRNQLRNAYVRLVVTRGVGTLCLDPRTCSRPSIVIIAESLPPLHGEDAAYRGIRVAIVPTRRNAIDTTSYEIKSLNYLNSVIARMEATMAETDEAILLDARGCVCESPICNVFVVIGNQLATPSPASGILHGITRAQVMALGQHMGLQVEESDITPYELINADEVFLTGTYAEIVPVVMVNGIAVGDGTVGPYVSSLLQKFRHITRDPRYGVRIDPEDK